MLTCKDFLHELNDYLDEALGSDLRRELETHVNNCPNCWVVFETTKMTIKVYKGQEPQTIPNDVHDRLMSALQKKLASKPATQNT